LFLFQKTRKRGNQLGKIQSAIGNMGFYRYQTHHNVRTGCLATYAAKQQSIVMSTRLAILLNMVVQLFEHCLHKMVKNGVTVIIPIQKTIANKGEMRIYEIRYRGTAQCW